MDIGNKIKKARMQSGLTQEEAAEALGVSRQTISNWENGKTYPDIVSVVKMSDLYNISLDRLLKENSSESGYLDYLGKSTDVAASKDKLTKIILTAVYLGIWAFSLIVFWFFISGSDAMGYSLMFLWILLPITTFVISLVIGKNNYRGKWIFAVIFGIMYMLAEYATFQAANMAASDKFNMPSLEMISVGTVISLLGMGIGSLTNHFLKRSKTDCR
ncbi:MAG: helix-turn-helix domain-containing protein [Oscillospiraceae bacterium]|nr:helix-turn-helix domain-containing protein [Oscillospiraceae bacterium]